MAWEKAVGGSGEFGADWPDPLDFLGFLARTADAHKTRRKCEKDQIVCDLKTQLRCATTLPSGDSAFVSCGDEGLSLDRDVWSFCGKHVRRNHLPVQRKRGNNFNWLRVFGQEPPSVAIRSLYADIFEIEGSG